jgi:hypothetical protein
MAKSLFDIKVASLSPPKSVSILTPSHGSTIAVSTSWSTSSWVSSAIQDMNLQVDEQAYERRVELSVIASSAVKGDWNKTAVPHLREVLSLRPAGFVKSLDTYDMNQVDSIEALRNQVPLNLPRLPEHERLCQVRDALLSDGELLDDHAWFARVSVAELVSDATDTNQKEKQVRLAQFEVTHRPSTRFLGFTLRKAAFVMTYHVAEIEYV